MDSVDPSRTHDRSHSVSTSSSPRQNEISNPPPPAFASPPISPKSSSRNSTWFVRPAAVPSSKASSPYGGRLHKRSGFQSGPDLVEKITERAKDSSQQLRLVKSGKHLDVGMGNEHQRRGVASAIHSRPQARAPSHITPDFGEPAKSYHRMSEAGSFNLAIVTPAREDDVTHLKTTKRERDNGDGDGNESKDGAKRPKYWKDISLDYPNPRRKGILKDPKRASVSNRRRRVRWAERLEDYNYPNEFKGIKTVRQTNPGVKFVHEAHGGNWDASYVSDALPEGLRDRSQNTSMGSPAFVPTNQDNQQSTVSNSTVIPPGDWFSTFLETLSEKEIHDLLAAYESLHQLVLPVGGVPGDAPAPSLPSASSEIPPIAAFGSEAHSSTTLDWRFGIVNPGGIVLQCPQLSGGSVGERVLPAILPNQDQAVPDLSASPDLSDHSLTPPSPALNRFDVAVDEDINLILPGGEHVEEGLDAKAVLFPEGPSTPGSFTSARHCGSNLGLHLRGGSGMGFEDRGHRPTPRTPGALLEKKHDMGNEYGALAAKRIAPSVNMGKARKEGQSDSTKKLPGPNGTRGLGLPPMQKGDGEEDMCLL